MSSADESFKTNEELKEDIAAAIKNSEDIKQKLSEIDNIENSHKYQEHVLRYKQERIRLNVQRGDPVGTNPEFWTEFRDIVQLKHKKLLLQQKLRDLETEIQEIQEELNKHEELNKLLQNPNKLLQTSGNPYFVNLQ